MTLRTSTSVPCQGTETPVHASDSGVQFGWIITVIGLAVLALIMYDQFLRGFRLMAVWKVPRREIAAACQHENDPITLDGVGEIGDICLKCGKESVWLPWILRGEGRKHDAA